MYILCARIFWVYSSFFRDINITNRISSMHFEMNYRSSKVDLRYNNIQGCPPAVKGSLYILNLHVSVSGNDIVNKKHYSARWHRQDQRLVCGWTIVRYTGWNSRSNVRRNQRYNLWKVSHHSYISILCPRAIMIYDAKWLSLSERIRRIKKLFIILVGRIQSLSADLCTKCHPDLYVTLFQPQVFL